jgi:uncharacterized peroxidase-related enzyme
MSRITAVDPAAATGKAKTLLDGVQAKFQITPNMFRVAAQSPAALQALIGFFGAVEGGSLNTRAREQIALAVARVNGCDYCMSAHSTFGRMAGLSEADLAAAREGRAKDPKVEAALRLALEVVDERGHLTDADLQRARAAGLSDGEIVEVVANAVLNIFTNYLNTAGQTEIDFPVVRAQSAA